MVNGLGKQSVFTLHGRRVTLAIAATTLLSLSCELPAQALGVHPYIAPLANGVPANLSRPASTPLLNIPDQVWNNGEGFPVGGLPDVGGYNSGVIAGRAPDDFVAGLTIGDVHSFADSSGPLYWHSHIVDNPSGLQLRQFVGYLRPAALGSYPNNGPVEDAAFEILAPLGLNPNVPIVIVIGTWSTAGLPEDPGYNGSTPRRFLYPGYKRADGLVLGGSYGDQISRPGPNLVDMVNNPPSGYQVIAAHIVPRTFPRPLVFEMQRYVQLAKAIDLMFSQPTGSLFLPPNFPSVANPLPKFLSGGSMGGFTAALGTLYYPNVFQGGSAGAFSASVRRTMGEQFAWNYVGRRSGMGIDETSLTIFDTLEWATWFRQQGSDYFSSSQMLRRRRGEQVHPLLYLVGDEDTVLRCAPSHLARCTQAGREAPLHTAFRVPFPSAPHAPSERNGVREATCRRVRSVTDPVSEGFLRHGSGVQSVARWYEKPAPDDRSRRGP